jgi:type III secretory pathway component EscT
MDTSKIPNFIPTDGATSHSTKLPKNGNQVSGYAVLLRNFLAYIYLICGAAKIYSRLAFGRNLNFSRHP